MERKHPGLGEEGGLEDGGGGGGSTAAKRPRCLECTKLHFKLLYGSAAGVGEESRCFHVKGFGVYSRLHKQLRSTTLYATVLIALPPTLFIFLFISVPGAGADATCSVYSLRPTLLNTSKGL